MIANGRKLVIPAGIAVRTNHAPPLASALWGYGQDRPYEYVAAAVRALQREGLSVRELPLKGATHVWARGVAEAVATGSPLGAVVFCASPGVVACVANKVTGVRAVPISTIAQASLASLELAANLLVVEMPGRTFFEVKQMLRALHSPGTSCPEALARTLQELDGCAHR